MNFFSSFQRGILVCAIVAESFIGLGACASSAPGTIGAAMGQRTDRRVFIRSLPPGQGADRAGLQVDDEVLLIDGKDVKAMTPEDIRVAVRGDVGSTLVLTILRGTEKREVKVTRSPLLAEGKSRP